MRVQGIVDATLPVNVQTAHSITQSGQSPALLVQKIGARTFCPG
jgi:hypothetical protein